ncbi:MAG: cbb3-type cytochrome c oxidase subunit I, partial [Candidatus Rokubacteria bacterium]|nr:cbb3-type cytochrome c oxidase subunit I [Candidatus Rokubacteria bacterium]
VFNWLATLWGGALRFTTAMMFAVAFIVTFTVGGVSGVMHAAAPSDLQQTDTYFVVAHIHYVLVGGALTGLFAGIYYWFPKMFGRMTSPLLCHLHFWPTFVFFNLTFFPMHIIGVGGQMRRIYNPLQYEFLQHQQHWNVIITISALALGLSQIPFVINFFWSLFAGGKAPLNPWNANTLEWTAPSPPPHLNWGPTLPRVYRGPYEYSSPESKEDFLPQTQPTPAGAAVRHH